MDFSQDVFLNKLAQTTPYPLLLTIERAEGIYLYSPDGRTYIDLISGIGVSYLGHSHPKIVATIKEQAEKHLHVMVYGEYIQKYPNKLAYLLTSLLPPQLNCCYFTNSGTEANEGALKLAKRITGRSEIVSCYQSYHGSTHGSLSVSGNEKKKNAFRPLLPDVRFIRFNNMQDLSHITTKTACVIMETIQGDAGVRIPTPEYLQAVRKRCDETGAQLILDEIQCGLGRTGRLFAFEHFNIKPDILTLGKALGGGLPIGAFVSSYENMQQLTHDPMLGHITTFGGNPLCCAAAYASLDVLISEKHLNGVEEKGKLFEKLLTHPRIKQIRRIGLFFAIDFETEEEVSNIVKRALELGVITFWFLSHPYSFRIAPPLTITEDEIRFSCQKIIEAIDGLDK